MKKCFVFMIVFWVSLWSPWGKATVLSRTDYVPPSEFLFGVETAFLYEDRAGLGTQFFVSQGIHPLLQWNMTFGTGIGVRGFHFGMGLNSDIVPDLETQPGMGIGMEWTASHYEIAPLAMALEGRLIPYVHHQVVVQEGESVDPYVSVPFGMRFFNREGFFAQFVVGVKYEAFSKFSMLAEFGVQILNASSFVALGWVYHYGE